MRSRLLTSILALSTTLALMAGGSASPPARAATEPHQAAGTRDYVDLVNPWVEADIGRFFFFQSAGNPFGMVKLRPDTSTSASWGTGYRRNENMVKGFSHLHEWRLSGLQMMPTSGESVPKLEGEKGWESHVEHDSTEIAEPGYHKLHLDRYDIDAELTTTDRVGMHRYTYRKAGPSEIVLNLAGKLGEAEMDSAEVTRVGERTIEGYVLQHGEGYAGMHDTRLYFDIRFDRPFDSLHGWAGGKLIDGGNAVEKVAGKDAGAYVRFDHLAAGDQVQMKVGLSLTGPEGARKNLDAELPGWDFDAVKDASQDRWNDMLGRVDVQGGTAQQQEKFYTDLFHVLCGRSMVSDADGAYLDDTWNQARVKQIPRGADGKPEFAMYNYDALWLTEWNVNSMLGLAYPDVYNSFVRSQLQMYEDGDLLPRGPVAGNYSMVMTGSPVTNFITGAYNKGIRDFDADLAYDAMLDAQSIGGLYDKAWFDYRNWNTGGNRQYLDLGYVPNGTTGQGAGQTLEYAHQDWALSKFAKQLRKRGINATQWANVTASSQSSGKTAERAIDGRPMRAPTQVEWASTETNPWLELTWSKPRNLRQIVLSDRADPASNVRGGTLEFSDGSRIEVSGIPADGSDKVVTFPARDATSVRFTATGGEGSNVGLNEIEAWDNTNVPDHLLERSRTWRKLYDKETGFIRPRNANGTWREPFDPLAGADFVEANAWQATWFTTHDVMGLANLMGGKDAYADKLNYAFKSAEPANFIGGYGEGYVSYGNQPGLEVAHLFNYVGKPWLTQHWVRQVKEKTFGSTATDDGYGHHDEDQGQMGALSALMGIGLFEVTGGGLERPVYDITSPIFDEVTIKLHPDYYDGGEFRIVTHGNSAANEYIQRAKLDGHTLNDSWFFHDQLADGGTLELWLDDKPNKQWGVDHLPPSESASTGEEPVNATAIEINGPESVDVPYGKTTFEAGFTPESTTLKKAFWTVTEPDGSTTEKASINNDGVLTVNHRDGEVLVKATAADSGGVSTTKKVTIGLDPAKLRSNASRWPGVKATASSQFSADYPARRVHDGFGEGTGDWASAGEQNPWVQLDWEQPIQADRIVLYDRTSNDDANAGTLTFSDGSSVKVSDVPAIEPKTIEFPMREFSWVRFQVEGGVGPNVGLLEFEVYGVPSSPAAPREVSATPGDGSATVSWQPPAFDGGAPVISYLLTPYRDGTALEPVEVDGSTREATVRGLSPGQAYTFTVKARNMAGTGPESDPSTAVTPR